MVSEFVNKVVKIDLDNGFYFKGRVKSFGDDYVVIVDINDKLVYITRKNITNLREVGL
jgi:sRNA-binding regulator protein Hfq